jgi:hypothetical protein
MWTLPEHLRPTAERIPTEIKAKLTSAELLARCERAAELEKAGFACSNDRTAMYGYLDQAHRVLKAMTPRQLAADLAVLNKGLAVAPSGLGGAYSEALAQLTADNPQPTAEHLARAEAAVAAYGPTRTWTREAPRITRAAPTSAPDFIRKG